MWDGRKFALMAIGTCSKGCAGTGALGKRRPIIARADSPTHANNIFESASSRTYRELSFLLLEPASLAIPNSNGRGHLAERIMPGNQRIQFGVLELYQSF